MSLVRTVLGRGRRQWLRVRHARLSATAATTELDLDGAARASLLDKIDEAAVREPEAVMQRLRGRTLFSDPYPSGTLLHRLASLLERSEAGDAVAIGELEKVIDGLDARDQLQFFRLREQFMAVRTRSVTADQIPPPDSDEEWRRVMVDAVKRFQEIGRHLQRVEAGRHRVSDDDAAVPATAQTPNDVSNEERISTPQPNLPSAARLYTDQVDIDAHTEADVGRFFDFMTASAALSEGLAGSLPDEYALTKTRKLLIRMAPLRIVSRCRALGQHDGYAPGTTVVLGGSAPGSGRSTALSYVAAWARARPDWLTVFVPDAARFSQSGRRMLRSRRRPDLFVQPDLQRDWLGELLAQQAVVLDRLPLQQPPPFASLRTLHDLVQHAVAEDADPDLIFDVFAELRAGTACRVLVAVDRYNAWLRPSAYTDPDARGRAALPAERLALVRCLMDLYDAGPAGGVTVAAMSADLPMPATAELKRDVAAAARDVVTVPLYAGAEVDAVLAHWLQSGWLVDIPGDLGAFKQYVRALSGDSPRELFRVLRCL